MKILTSLIVSLCTLTALHAQSFRETFTEANLLTEDGYYGLAIPLWEQLLELEPNNANLNYKLGRCYLNLGLDRDKAMPYLLKASTDIRKNYDPFMADFKGSPIETYYYLGLSHHINGDLDAAQKLYEKFLSLASGKHFLREDAERGLKELANAREFMANPVAVKITNLGGPINSPFAEYAPIVAFDENMIYFTSRRLRPDSTNKGDVDVTTGLYYEDMYMSYRNIKGQWMNPELLNINIPGEHSSVVSMGNGGTKIYIHRIYNGVGNIYESDFIVGQGWSTPSLVGGGVNSSHNEYFAAVTANEKRLYFVSDRPGGLGGNDIWYADKLPNGQWGKAINLGAPINSEMDDDAPFIHPDGKTLYFSSNGHKSMGGYDIFYSQLDANGKWSAPKNMGYPINSTDNDHSFITTPSGKRGYYASKGSSSLGSTDIYIIDFDQNEKNVPEVDMSAQAVLKGYVFNPTQSIPDSLKVTIIDPSTKIELGTAKPVKRNGSFVFIIPSGKSYEVNYNLGSKKLYSEVVAIPSGVQYQEIEREVFIYTDQNNRPKAYALNDKVLTDAVKWKMSASADSKAITFGSRVLYLDENGNVLDTVYVNKDGYFEFKKLAADVILKPLINMEDQAQIVIQLVGKEQNIELINVDGVYYEKGKTPDQKAKLAANTEPAKPFLKSREEVKQTKQEKFSKANNLKSQSVTIYLDYNQTTDYTDEPDFTAAVSYLVHYCKNGNNGNVQLIASASKVPTSAFGSNQELADARLEAFKIALNQALQKEGVDMNKISTISEKAVVDGPSYSQNTSMSKVDFIEYQFIRLIIN